MAARTLADVRRVAALSLAVALIVGPAAQQAHAENDLIGGIGDILNGVFALPLDTLAGTLSGPPIIGTVGGVLHGAVRTIGSTLRGVFRLIGVAIPIAEKLAPLIPVFL